MFENTPEIPAWVQFPRRVFYENMMVQFTEGLPGLVVDEDGERAFLERGGILGWGIVPTLDREAARLRDGCASTRRLPQPRRSPRCWTGSGRG